MVDVKLIPKMVRNAVLMLAILACGSQASAANWSPTNACARFWYGWWKWSQGGMGRPVRQEKKIIADQAIARRSNETLLPAAEVMNNWLQREKDIGRYAEAHAGPLEHFMDAPIQDNELYQKASSFVLKEAPNWLQWKNDELRSVLFVRWAIEEHRAQPGEVSVFLLHISVNSEGNELSRLAVYNGLVETPHRLSFRDAEEMIDSWHH